MGIRPPSPPPRFQTTHSAFGMSPEQRKADALHRAVTASLLPGWADMPYYHPSGETLPSYRPKLGFASDHEAISAIVANPDSWETATTLELSNGSGSV